MANGSALSLERLIEGYLEAPNSEMDQVICTMADLIKHRGIFLRKPGPARDAKHDIPSTDRHLGKTVWSLGAPKPCDIVRVNVGGTRFSMDCRLLEHHEPENLITLNLRQAKNFAPAPSTLDTKSTIDTKSDDKNHKTSMDEKEELYYDRDAENFRLIWSYVQGCRSMLRSMPKWRLQMLRFDADYFGFHTMVQDVDWALHDQPVKFPEHMPMYLDVFADMFATGPTTKLTDRLCRNLAKQYLLLSDEKKQELLQSVANTSWAKFLTRPSNMPSQPQSTDNATKAWVAFVQTVTSRSLLDDTEMGAIVSNIRNRNSICVRMTVKTMSILKAGITRVKSLCSSLALLWNTA